MGASQVPAIPIVIYPFHFDGALGRPSATTYLAKGPLGPPPRPDAPIWTRKAGFQRKLRLGCPAEGLVVEGSVAGLRRRARNPSGNALNVNKVRRNASNSFPSLSGSFGNALKVFANVSK